MPDPAPDPAPDPSAPPRDCPLCPRLVEYRDRNRAAEPGWWNGPVPSWGPRDARLLVVGLAPGVRGANRTGRPFTGDYAGTLLYETLERFGFAAGRYDARPDDGLELRDCRIANAVRCVPPANLPTPAERRTCNPFLRAEIDALPKLEAVLALGVVAHEATLRALELKLAPHKFRHGTVHALPDGRVLADSYHVSRYNTNTGVLTPAMFEAVVAALRARLDGSAAASG